MPKNVPSIKIKVDITDIKKALDMIEELKGRLDNTLLPVTEIRIGPPYIVPGEIQKIENMNDRKDDSKMDNKKISKMTQEEYTKRWNEIYEETDSKQAALKEFKIEKLSMERAWGLDRKKFEEIAEKVVDILKEEELTYEQAYATLQQAYNQLKYESNFLKI